MAERRLFEMLVGGSQHTFIGDEESIKPIFRWTRRATEATLIGRSDDGPFGNFVACAKGTRVQCWIRLECVATPKQRGDAAKYYGNGLQVGDFLLNITFRAYRDHDGLDGAKAADWYWLSRELHDRFNADHDFVRYIDKVGGGFGVHRPDFDTIVAVAKRVERKSKRPKQTNKGVTPESKKASRKLLLKKSRKLLLKKK